MALKDGIRKIKAYQGNFGQSGAAGSWKAFAGILADKQFLDGSEGMSLAMSKEPGRARRALSLVRTKRGGMKGKAMSSAIKAEIMGQRDTIDEQNERISDLEGQIEGFEGWTPPENEITAPGEPVPTTDPDVSEENMVI
jgi:hypothetical protein